MRLNKVQLIGRLGKDPEIKTFDKGNKIAEFSIATDESYKNKQGEKVDKAEWHNISVPGKLAEIVEKYITKGMEVYIEGKNTTQTYEKDGQKKYIHKVVAYNIQMGSSNKNTDLEQKNTQQHTAPQNNVHQDQLPF